MLKIVIAVGVVIMVAFAGFAAWYHTQEKNESQSETQLDSTDTAMSQIEGEENTQIEAQKVTVAEARVEKEVKPTEPTSSSPDAPAAISENSEKETLIAAKVRQYNIYGSGDANLIRAYLKTPEQNPEDNEDPEEIDDMSDAEVIAVGTEWIEYFASNGVSTAAEFANWLRSTNVKWEIESDSATVSGTGKTGLMFIYITKNTSGEWF